MKRLSLFFLVLCALGFAAGLFQLFKLRFEVGDVYPPYSSLRSDPLGTMAFCESLEKMPGLSVRRDFSAANRLPEGKGSAYLHLAAMTSNWKWMPDDLFKEIQAFLAGGGRLAITFFPATAKPSGFWADDEEQVLEKPAKQKAKANQKTEPVKSAKSKKRLREDEEAPSRTSLKEKWGVEFGFSALEPGEAEAWQPALAVNKTDLALPDSLEWHSATIFTNLDKSWRTIYARGTNAVVIERKFGAGTVVMATDSYFLSNEAMRKDRHADLLAWLVGPSQCAVFDEAHFGIVETSGVATLMRKYRLHGLAAGLILLAGLFIWKNSMSFVPPNAEENPAGYVAGKEASAGFVNLLRRNVPARDLLEVCFAEWKKSFTHGGKHPPAKVEQAQALVVAEHARPQRERDPIQTYQEICRILKTPGFSRDRENSGPNRKPAT